MIKDKYNIAITVIGSGIGQSIINSLNLSALPVKTFGFGNNPMAFGAYECDVIDYTSGYYESGYVQKLIRVCKKHKIDLLVPCHDDEALVISKHINKFEKANIKTIISDYKLIALCRDKERLGNELNKITNIFVDSYRKDDLLNKTEIDDSFFPLIAKPKDGFASNNIKIVNSVSDLNNIDDDYLIQEIAFPSVYDPNYEEYLVSLSRNKNPQLSEISIQIVFDKVGEIIGKMMSVNKLRNGVPVEIIPIENERVWNEISKIVPRLVSLGAKGPINLQGRITDGGLKLFEINPRFTGITGLRAKMGFNEVEGCLKEWLGIDKENNKLSISNNRFGVRQVVDKSISYNQNNKVKTLKQRLNSTIEKQVILITGATGYLGQNFVKQFEVRKGTQFDIWAFSRSKDIASKIMSNRVSRIFDHSDFNKGRIPFGKIDILLHFAFTRQHGSDEQIAESLKFTSEIFTLSVQNQVPSIINISSQSVYGFKNKPPWCETNKIAPETVYGQAKYASELILNSLVKFNNHINFTSLRLGTIVGGYKGLIENDLFSKIIKDSLKRQKIVVYGGNQQIERIDIKDVIEALILLIETKSCKWEKVYNIGVDKSYTLIQIVDKIVDISKKYTLGNKSQVIVKSNDKEFKQGLNSTNFKEQFGWSPKVNIDRSIESIFDYFLKVNR